MTRIGSKCLEGDMDIRNNLLVEVGAKLGIEAYARVASAFMASGVGLFPNSHAGIRKPIGLTEEQKALASKHGDVHTAVEWYLKWHATQKLPDDAERCFNILCFKKMFSFLDRNSYFAKSMTALDELPWALRLQVALGFTFQKDIVCVFGTRCVTCHINEDPRRVKCGGLAYLNAEVEISKASVCHDAKERDKGSWMVYVKTARFPHVSALSVLPPNIAAWFSHFHFRQEKEFDFREAFCCLLDDPRRIAEFTALLIATDKGGVMNSNLAAKSSIETMPPSSEQHRVIPSPAGAATSSTQQHRAAPSDAAASMVAVKNQTDAREGPRFACSHELVRRVNDILKGACDVETGELVQTLKSIGKRWPHLKEAAKSLAEEVMKADAPIHGDTTRKDLAALLEMLLKGRTDFSNRKKRIRKYVYHLHVNAVKELFGDTKPQPGECVKMSLVQQEGLLRRALNGMDGSENGPQAIQTMSTNIASTQIEKTVNEMANNKAKKRLDKARQRIDPHSRTMTWAVKDDIRDEVRAAGVRENEVEKQAQWIWKEYCFQLDIYRNKDREEGTMAEFVRFWLQKGFCWDQCKDLLWTLKKCHRKPPRQISPGFREETRKRLREEVARTYVPNPKRRAR